MYLEIGEQTIFILTNPSCISWITRQYLSIKETKYSQLSIHRENCRDLWCFQKRKVADGCEFRMQKRKKKKRSASCTIL